LERIYETIRDRICLLEYAPNTRLAEEELADEFNVSRTPIRSVLIRLELEGLVQIRHGAGTFVTDVDFTELLEVYRLRKELAGLISKLDMREVSEREIAKFRKLTELCATITRSRNPKRAFAKINIRYFKLVSGLSKNKTLYKIMERLFFQSERIWFTVMPDEQVAAESAIFALEIEEISQALEERHFALIGKIHCRHVANGLKRLKGYGSV